MSIKRIGVVGASGFVGATLVERLLARGDVEVVPFIHSSGNAMRLARRGIELRMLDLMDRAGIEEALDGITHVVNCSRGGNDVMLTGLKNLLAACRARRVERFVHLSSVAVYGDPPPPQSVHEDATTEPARGSYGWTKLEQDRMVKKAAGAGLPCSVLCPPNISGPYSYFLLMLVGALRSGRFALLDDGAAPCSLVDVSNLCRAMELALDQGPAEGDRMFVTDDEKTTWRDVVEAVLPLTELSEPVPRISRDQLSRAATGSRAHAGSLGKSLKHLVSSDVRQAIRKDPLWEKVDGVVRRAVARMGKSAEDSMRLSVEGPVKVAKIGAGPVFDAALCRQQLRGVWHSCEGAKKSIGYLPAYNVEQSMQAFRAWYRIHAGMDTEYWGLLRQLG